MCWVINQMAVPHDMWGGAQQLLAVGDLTQAGKHLRGCAVGTEGVCACLLKTTQQVSHRLVDTINTGAF